MNQYKNILNALEHQLYEMERANSDILIRAEKGLKMVKSNLRKMRQMVVKKGFKSDKNEITFFKEIKPRLYSKLIYYAKIFNIESKRPRGSIKSQIKYLNFHIAKHQDFFNDHLEFYHYYRRNATELDELYFLRENMDLRLYDCHYYFSDEQFSTSRDNIVAVIMAYDLLIVYLKKEIEILENNYSKIFTNVKQSRFFWTAHKTDLVELIYALHSSGVINSGTTDIKKIATIFENLFNIDLGDYYHTFLEIRSRKVNPTKFIDYLKESLLQKMADLDV